MSKLCRKCGKSFRGMGRVCDCIMNEVTDDRTGQIGIFSTEKVKTDWQEFCQYIDEVLGVTTEKQVPEGELLKWIGERCRSRKTREDWGGLGALYRDFTSWRGETFSPASFEQAVIDAGYAVNRGMVARLLLKEDYGHLQVRSPKVEA
jgi:hypothetical protein